jgi:hypothetical protein
MTYATTGVERATLGRLRDYAKRHELRMTEIVTEAVNQWLDRAEASAPPLRAHDFQPGTTGWQKPNP